MNRELLDWISEARAFARANMHPPVVEPANVVSLTDWTTFMGAKTRTSPGCLRSLWGEGMNIGGLIELAVQDVVVRGHVGLIKGGGTWVRPERVPEAERRNLTQDRTKLLQREPLRRTQILQDPTKAQG